MIDTFVSARLRSTPLIAIRTPDPTLTINAVEARYQDIPIYSWDIVSGASAVNNPAQSIKNPFADCDSTKPVEALEAATNLPARGILFLLNAHRYADQANYPGATAWVQAVWNLRNLYKTNGRTLVLLCPDIQLPAELAQDVMVIDEPLPGPEELRLIIQSILKDTPDADPNMDPAIIDKAIDATCGLASFPAEQVTAMALYRDKSTGKVSLNIPSLWLRKAQMIEQTPGLSVWRSGARFEDIGGYENAKTFLQRIIRGKRSPRCFVFLDEIEKMFAGATGGTSDTSGVSQGFLGTMLSYMEDTDASGVIFIGAPGTGKSQVAKAAGNTADVPTIAFDLAGMKASLVGESEQRLRTALKVVSAVSQGKAFFIATSNRIASLPPELRRRFKSGTFYFPLPSAREREPIWQIYLKRYAIPDQPRPNDTDWTGAEIKQCCYLAAEELGCSLIEASAYIVPVARSAEREIAELNAQANGRFISASYSGFYKHEGVETAQAASRMISAIED